MIKAFNSRKDGYLFHYAHFICDCLFVDVINKVFHFDKIIRMDTIDQKIGHFSKIYEEVLNIKNVEININDYNNLPLDTVRLGPKEKYISKENFDIFKQYIFSVYKIDDSYDNNQYPPIILVKRNHRRKLVENTDFKEIQNTFEQTFVQTTGSERREIRDINKLDDKLNEKYKNKFKSVYFEDIPFDEQIKYFNNAKIIICAHGAVMANTFFCKENTILIEVVCDDSKYIFFDAISALLNLNHIKCYYNDADYIFNKVASIETAFI